MVRCNNVYGEGQFPEKLIPKFIQLLREGKRCTIHGLGDQARVFIHVSDVVKAYEIILKKGHLGEIYNIGSEDKHSVLEVTKMIIERIRPDSTVEECIKFVADRNYNDASYDISWNKLTQLGWHAEIPFTEGLDRVISWFSSIDVHKHWPNLDHEHL